MSASEPDTPGDANDPKGSVAQFPMVRRGYERHLVDARLAELLDQLNTQRRRADEAEQALQQLQLDINTGRQLPAWFTTLGAEVRQVGEQAATAAEQLLAEVGTRAQAAIDGAEAEAAGRRRAAEEQASNLEQTARETLAQAQAERARIQAEANAAAEEVRARADRDATAVLDKAQEEATLAWQKAARERVLLEAETERLTTLRQRMVEQLGQVYAPLGLTLVDTRGELEPSNEAAHQVPIGELGAPATTTEPDQIVDERPENQGEAAREEL